MSKSSRVYAFSIGALMAAIVAPNAIAGTPSGAFAVFSHCPYATNPDVGACLYATIKGGEVKLGSSATPLVVPAVLQGGLTTPFDASPLYDPVGAPTLSPAPQPVPGGLLGIVNPAPDWPFPLWTAFWSIVNTVNGVTATTELVGPVQTNFSYAVLPPTDGTDPTAILLPVRVRLQNPFLGGTCYIGSASNPIVIHLQTGTTNPPAPNQPISGSPGNVELQTVPLPDGSDGYIISTTDAVAVDNSFAVPGAKGCGNIALGLPIITDVLDFLVSGAVNLKQGLPSPAGKNSAVMSSDFKVAASQFVQASEQ